MDVLAIGRCASTGTTVPAVIVLSLAELSPLLQFCWSECFSDQFQHNVCLCHALLFLHGGLDLLMCFSTTLSLIST